MKTVGNSTDNTYIVCIWTFSRHSKERLPERGYSRDDILKVLNEEVPSINVESPRETTVDLHFGKIDSRYVLVVIDRDTHHVITVRPMRRKEIVEYEKEMHRETRE